MEKQKNKKLRILAAGDIHGDSKTTKKLAEKAEKENVDLVILTGDLTGWTETKDLIKPFTEKHKKVLIIPGNWDSFATADFLANVYGVKNIHGYSVKYENIGIFGAGGARGPGPGDISDNEIMKTLEKAHSSLRGIERKIMITHMHPAGSKSEFSGIPGSRSIARAIEKFKPNILLHSHIHEAHGFEEYIGKTKVINVGREGKIIEI
ncbi:metallophosphoesterase [Candidatus Pacearchaeota archaeon]|nr:metallophosphoesterase [Candidatus Pacearchaeota archaeon]